MICARKVRLALLMAGSLAGCGSALASEGRDLGRKVFGDVVPTLSKDLELMDRHDSLPKDKWIGEDQESNQRAMDALLDEAIASLGISPLDNCRKELRRLDRRVQQGRERLNVYRREQVSAPKEADLSTVQRVWRKSKEDYAKLIAEEEKAIADAEKKTVDLKAEFAKQMKAIGLDLGADAIESLLSSVSGDDFISMCAVFDNIKMVTEQLQKLTEQTGEDLATAKRYYGMYVVLVKVMDRVQKKFIRTIRTQHIPKLKELGRRAQKNIDEAQALIDEGIGDAKALRGNIASNRLTKRATEYYADYLEQQARMIDRENERVLETLATAENTYKTVKLSSDVASLITSGRRNFDALMRLKLPPLREFKNQALQKQFQSLTSQMRGET